MSDPLEWLRHDLADWTSRGLRRTLKTRATPQRAEITINDRSLINFGSNALKYGKPGGLTQIRVEPMPEQRLRLLVKDDGIGIPKDALKKLGKPFEQVESQLTKSHRGSGLGLAIAKSLSELHGGAMRIRSTLGTGTIVLVRLPLDAGAVITSIDPTDQMQSEAIH